MNPNREIFNTVYSCDNLVIAPVCKYDRDIIALRFALIDKYCKGGDALDLCCGTGSYLLPSLGKMGSAVGLDFSRKMLAALKKSVEDAGAENVSLVEADAAKIPLKDSSVDFVYSYTSLYAVPNTAEVIREVGRTLRPGGHAVLEMGNKYSLNGALNWYQHRTKNWPRPYLISFGEMRRAIAAAGLSVVDRYSFQLLPMYEVPKKLFFLYPLLTPEWKKLMGLRVGDRVLDNAISGAPLLRSVSFRHIFIVKKES